MHELTSSEWAKCCAEDGEFNQCARFWTGTFAIQSGDNERWLRVVDGAPQIEAAESAPTISTSSTKAMNPCGRNAGGHPRAVFL